jgi:hypothetical protein
MWLGSGIIKFGRGVPFIRRRKTVLERSVRTAIHPSFSGGGELFGNVFVFSLDLYF